MMAPKVILRIESSAGFGRDLLRGIGQYSRIHGPWVFYRELGGVEKPLPPLCDWRPDGIIARIYDTRSAKKAVPQSVPTIAVPIREQIGGMPNVLIDDESVGAMAAEHLLGLGLHHFAFCGRNSMFWSVHRSRGFAQRIGEAGFEAGVYRNPKSKGDNLWQNEQRILAEWLRTLSKPLGLMACNDARSHDVIEACRIEGLRVPDDVAVIGVDDDELLCQLSEPAITSVHISTENAGYRAAELLDKMMGGYRREDEHIKAQPTRVAIRQSTDILATDNKGVAEAVRFIRQNAKHPVGVNDVVEATAVPRRTLYDQFQRTLGRSIKGEIKRVRTEEIRKRLLETDMSISEIATELGFSSTNHIARYFAQEMGMSPLACRKQYGKR